MRAQGRVDRASLLDDVVLPVLMAPEDVEEDGPTRSLSPPLAWCTCFATDRSGATLVVRRISMLRCCFRSISSDRIRVELARSLPPPPMSISDSVALLSQDLQRDRTLALDLMRGGSGEALARGATGGAAGNSSGCLLPMRTREVKVVSSVRGWGEKKDTDRFFLLADGNGG